MKLRSHSRRVALGDRCATGEARQNCARVDGACRSRGIEAKAEQVRQKLLAMQKQYLIELGDAVVAVRDAAGRVKLNQLVNTTAVGAASGAFWGTLIGMIFLTPLGGAAIGAASGALGGALSDVGINDKWMKETAAAIKPGTAALFVLVRRVTAVKVLDGSPRALPALVVGLLRALGVDAPAADPVLGGGAPVGEVRATV